MITIKKTIRKISINTRALKADAQKLLDILGYSDFDLGIWLTTDKTIRKYNKIYRNQDKVTDILSFPYYPDLDPGKRIKAETEEEKNLGDIIISLEHVIRDSKRLKGELYQLLQHLLVHGICHLLGYTHDTETLYKQMQKKERFLLEIIRKT